MMRFVISMLLLIFGLSSVPLTAQTAAEAEFEYWPGATYDATVPTLEGVIGHKVGERVTRPGDVIDYFEALAAHAPDRIRVFEYARSWEDRPLIAVAIGSAQTMARLDDIKSGMRALSDPRSVDAAQAEQLIGSLPATVMLAYGVHGNEISSTDAAIMTAYHLLAAENDPVVENILANTLVLLDPMQNPDGRNRFVHNFETTEGLENDGSRIAAERNEPWPGGRTNHYLFDMNRDWFALTQPETQGRIRLLREWLPLVFVDAHEMGTDSTYYFAPEAVPYNPHLAKAQRASLEKFGRNNAKWFDQFGFDYFTREVYDAFYPGYGASWPSYYGAVAMTYEQASARGLKARRSDGTEYEYRDTVRQHFVASISTAEATANNREALIRDFYNYRQSAIEEGRSEDIKTYLFPAENDRAAATKIAGLLTRQGVDVAVATADFSACGKEYAEGTIAISAAQPSKRLIRTLLEPDVPLEKTFVEEQERLRKKDLPDQIYDVTAWSLPMMYGAQMDRCSEAVNAGFRPHTERLAPEGSLTNPTASVAFLVPWGEATATRLLAHAFQRGLAVLSTDKSFTHNDITYPAGTLIFPRDENPDDLADILTGLAEETGATVTGVDSGWVTQGPNFGSRNVVRLRAPKIAMAWDAPTSAYAAGNTRFVVERQFDYPVTPVRVSDLTDRDLDRFDVLIMPGEARWYGGGYADRLGKSGAERLANWVRSGGTIIGTAGAVRWLSHPDVDLLAVQRENAFREEKPEEQDDKKATTDGTLLKSQADFEDATAPARESPDGSAGVLLRAQVDKDHWLGAGVKPYLNVLARGSDVYTPIARDAGTNVAYFAGPENVLASGYLWKETKDQMAYKPFVIHQRQGGGNVIAFTQDPTVRAYLDGLNTIFMNALFRAPAHADRQR